MHIRRNPRRTGRRLPLRRAQASAPARTARAGGILLGVAALLVSACSAGASTTSATSAADVALGALPRSTPAALAPYYAQKARWRECGVPGFQCATLRAPLDYDPAGRRGRPARRHPQEGHRAG
ncbi:hypothetical protein M2159_003778 [Streptomyces sp. SAI-090]|nr:hypothetical protein [Streptomyces sp. SAI-090]